MGYEFKDDWMSYSDLLKDLKNLPEWMEKSLTGKYFESRVNNTFSGELTKKERDYLIKQYKEHDHTVIQLTDKIEKTLKSYGYDVKFKLDKNGVFDIGIRPSNLKDNSYKEYTTYSLGLDKGSGLSAGVGGGYRVNKLIADEQGNIMTVQEKQLSKILEIFNSSSTRKLLGHYNNRWDEEAAIKIHNKLFPAGRIGELAILNTSKSKLNKIENDMKEANQVDMQQLSRRIIQSREINFNEFYKQQAEAFIKADHDLIRKHGGNYKDAVVNVANIVKDVTTTILTLRADNTAAKQIGYIRAQNQGLIDKSAQALAQWDLYYGVVEKIHNLPFTWSGEAANIAGTGNIAIGRHNSIRPGAELSEAGNKAERAASNMLTASNLKKRENSQYTRPLKVFTKTMEDYYKAVQKEYNEAEQIGVQRREQAGNFAYLDESVKFNPKAVMDAVLTQVKKVLDPKASEGDKKKAELLLGKDSKYIKAWEKLGYDEEKWKKQFQADFEKSLDFEQVLISKGALPLFNSYRANKPVMIAKNEFEAKVKKITKQKKVSMEAARILAAKEFVGGINPHIDNHNNIAKGNNIITDEEGNEYVQILSSQLRLGQTGSKAMLGSGLHGTMDEIDDTIAAVFLASLGFDTSDLFDTQGRFKVAGIFTKKANARTLGMNTGYIINNISGMLYDEITNNFGDTKEQKNNNRIQLTDKQQIAQRITELKTRFSNSMKKFLDTSTSEGREVANKVSEIMSGYWDLSTDENGNYRSSLGVGNLQILADEALKAAGLEGNKKGDILQAFEFAMVDYMDELYKGEHKKDFLRRYGTQQYAISEDKKNIVYAMGTNKERRKGSIIQDSFGQPDIALYGNTQSKGGRAGSFGYKNKSNLMRAAHLATNNDSNMNLHVFEKFYDDLVEDGLKFSKARLGMIQSDVDSIINSTKNLTKEDVEANKDLYHVLSDKDIFREGYFGQLHNLVQETVKWTDKEGKEHVRRGYDKTLFENSIYSKILEQQKAGKEVLWNYDWAGFDTDIFGSQKAMGGNYIKVGNLDFEEVEIGGKTYYVPADTAAGDMSLNYIQNFSSLIHRTANAKQNYRDADEATRGFAELAMKETPIEYLKDLQDLAYEKNSAIVEGANKAQLRHSAGFKLIAAPEEDSKYQEILSQGSRAIMGKEVMRNILRSHDPNEDKGAHQRAIYRMAKELGIKNVTETEKVDQIIDKILDIIDVDSANFGQKGITGVGLRYPMLTDLNMPGLEFFVSSKHSMNNKNKSSEGFETLMVEKATMDMFNADVDGDMAYMYLTLADAQAGAMSDEDYEELLKTHKALKEYNDRIVQKIHKYNGENKERRTKAAIRDTIVGQNTTQTEQEIEKLVNEEYEQNKKKKADEAYDFVRSKDLQTHNTDTDTDIITMLAGEATKKNFLEVGKYDNLRQMIQNFEQVRHGGIWKIGRNNVKVGQTKNGEFLGTLKDNEMDPQELLRSLIAVEFATILPQEGISAKKVYEKLKDNAKINWGNAKTDEEREKMIENAFKGIYDRLKTPETFKSRDKMIELGKDLAAWGLINIGKNQNTGADKRVATIMAMMAEATGDDTWLDKNLAWDDGNGLGTNDISIIDYILDYDRSISNGKILIDDINGTGKQKYIDIGGLSDLLKYQKNNLLPNSRVASFGSIAGKANEWKNLSSDRQKALLDELKTPQARDRIKEYYGLGFDTPDEWKNNLANGVANLDKGYYQALYLNMAGMSGGTQQDLVESALKQSNYGDTKPPRSTIASQFSHFMYDSGSNTNPQDRMGVAATIDFLQTLREYSPNEIKKASEADRNLARAQYEAIRGTFRGNVMNSAQIIGKYGRTSKGEINTVDNILKAMAMKDENKAAELLGMDKGAFTTFKEKWNNEGKAFTFDEFRTFAKQELGVDFSNYSYQDILDYAQQIRTDANAPYEKVLKSHMVTNASHAMSSGGSAAQRFAAAQTYADLVSNPDEINILKNVTDLAAKTLEGYDVVSQEANLAGFFDNSSNKNVKPGDTIRGVRGSADLVLKNKNGGGVTIADFKSTKFVPRGGIDPQYLGQLLAYGYGYTQTRNELINNRDKYETFEEFEKSDYEKMMKRLMGGTIDKDLFDTMISEDGELKKIQLNYTDPRGNVRTFTADYQRLMDSDFGQAIMGALADKAFNNNEEVNFESLSKTSWWENGMKAFEQQYTVNEYADAVKGMDKKEVLEDYQNNLKKILHDQKEINKELNKMQKAGIAFDENGKDASNQYLAALRDEIAQLELKNNAYEKSGKFTEKEIELLKREIELEKERQDQEQTAEERMKKRKENYEGFGDSLKGFIQYQEQSWQLEQQIGNASGKRKKLLMAEKELIDSELQESSTALISWYSNLDEDQQKQAQRSLTKAQKRLELDKAKMEANQQPGLGEQFLSGVKRASYRFGVAGAGFLVVNKIAQSVKNTVNYAKQLDQVMTNLSIVMSTNRDELGSLMEEYNQLGKQLGATTIEVANSANVWLRQGYAISEVNDLIKASMYLSKLGMMDSGTAAKDLTAILKGFKLEASEAADVVSRLTMLDQSAAVSAGDIATAMQNVSTTAQQAGMSLDTTMAYISTIADVSQKDAGSVGSSLRTIMSRYGTVKAGKFTSMGGNDTSEDLQNLNDIETVLRKVGMTIRSNTMEFKDFDDVINELAEKWSAFGNVERQAIATAFAGRNALCPNLW